MNSLVAPWPTLDHYQGDSLSQLLVTMFIRVLARGSPGAS